MQLNLILVFVVSLFTLNSFEQAKSAEKQAFIIGERLEYHSKVLDEDRMLNIYLPNGYSVDSAKTYPVIYLLDGSKDEDFIHIAGLVQFASYPWINMVQESIVIGIENVDRKRDFCFPTSIEQDKIDFPTTGGSAAFIEFIETELQPYVESAYKVQNEKTIIGQSLGGLLATEILAKKPDMFDKYLIVSPSLWWDNQSLLDLEFAAYEGSKDVFVAVGEEGKVMKRDAKKLYKKLKKTKLSSEILGFKFLKEQDHGDALHLAVYHAFEAMKVIVVAI
ncbi:MAG: alpha/beta hydrolase-fold protein [Crocinitomicaceae bacterium]|nr:alpha/beta hydrolase-fold protein [Crocinitomicaceae bacterium]